MGYNDKGQFRTSLSVSGALGGQQQYFRVRPQDIQVVEGQVAELQCHIANLAGPVQWSKDGFVLGFDPSIPGFPRYTMIVDTHRGVYNLRIQNVQLEDEAEYQCQVGPAHKNHAIWTAAQLNVLVPSKEVELRHRGNGSIVEVREAEHVNIACWVRNTKPVSHIKWFRNGSPLPKDKVQSKEDASGEKLFSVYTSITLYPKLDDNHAVYTCEVHHPALTAPLRSSVTISVLYPPGVPEIEGYQDGDIVQVGDTLTLACISRGGNPPATLTWTKDGVLLTAKYKNATREATNTYTFTVTAGDNNAVYRCEATNLVTLQPFEASVKLSVLFAPSRVSITGPKEAKAGDMVTMTCTTAPSNPSVDVAWKLDGSAVQPASDQSTVQTKEGWVTSSNLTITLTRQDPDVKSFTCLAESQKLQETVIQSASLKIIYPPRPPVIIGYEEGTPIMAHSIQRIKCVSIGGNPLPTVKWYKGLKEYASLSTVTGSGVSSVLEIMAQPDDNQATYSCKAANSATSKPLTTSIKTTVLFAPKAVSITVVPQAPKEGDTVVLTCESGSSNPESSIQWLHNGNPTASHHQSRVDAQHGGKATRSRVRLNVTAADDGAVFTCRASNDIQEGAQDSVSLRVLHKPLFLHPPMEKYEVKQGETVLLNVSARANPSKMNYAWTKDGVPLPGPDDAYSWQETVAHKVFYRGPALHVYQAQKDDSGDYECEASNSQGATKTTIIVKVLYPATVTKISKYAMVGSGENASFECVVDANPLTEDVIRWRRHGFDMRRRTRVVLEKGRSYLTVYNVSDQDKGAFECVAHNGLGEEFVRSTLLIVKFKAVMHSPREPLTTVAADVGRSLRLSCSADGAPKVTFVWTVEDAVIAETATGGHRHAIHVEQLDVLRWESVLMVKYVHAQDYGQYSCTARNELGSDSARFRVRPRGKPDPPEGIRVLNTTHTSVLLSWMAGFNGGLDQQFRIRFRRTEDETNAYDYTDLIPEDVSLYLIGGLEPGTEYAFSVLGRNALGESDYSEESEPTSTLFGWPDQDASSAMIDAFSGRKGEVPRLLLVSVAVVGTLLLLLNAVLVICFVKRRKRRQQQLTGCEKDSMGTAADTRMYTPSKYHETINGEALRPLSDHSLPSNGRANGQEEIAMKEIPMEQNTLTPYPGLGTYDKKDLSPSTCSPLSSDVTCQSGDNCPDLLKTRGYNESEAATGRQMVLSTSFPSKDVLSAIDSRYAPCPMAPVVPANGTLGRSTPRTRHASSALRDAAYCGGNYGATLPCRGARELIVHSPSTTAGDVHAPVSCVLGKVGSHMV